MKRYESMNFGEIPIGIDDFKKMRNINGYYIDKSDLIEQILSQMATEVFLFTRPRRFGKTLNMSMIDAFFNQKYKGNSWFDGLKISKTNKFDEEKNAHPVIFINLKDLNGSTYESFIELVRAKISGLYLEFEELRYSDKLADIQKSEYEAHLTKTSNPDELMLAISSLCKMLERHYGKKVIVLIDEYDNPIHKTYGTKLQRRILEFMKNMLSSVLKSNTSLRFAVLTGVMQIAKESIFSGLNNLRVNNIFNKDFDEMFGFTPSEVQKLCSDYGHPERFEEAKEWYDGYRFGNAEIYNPWSVLNYVAYGFDTKPYWAGTSGNDIVRKMLQMLDWNTADDIRKLISGDTVTASISPSITFSDEIFGGLDDVFSVMAMSGYLNAVRSDEDDPDAYIVSIPNREMVMVFRSEIYGYFKGMRRNKYVEFVDSMSVGDINKMRRILLEVLSSIGEKLLPNPDIESIDHDSKYREANYNILLLAIVDVASDLYKISADMESWLGRSDISMVSRDPARANIIIELKWKDDIGKDLCKVADGAIEQIHNRKYYLGMGGKTMLYGIAFRKRDVCISSDVHLSD